MPAASTIGYRDQHGSAPGRPTPHRWGKKFTPYFLALRDVRRRPWPNNFSAMALALAMASFCRADFGRGHSITGCLTHHVVQVSVLRQRADVYRRAAFGSRGSVMRVGRSRRLNLDL